MALGIVLLDMLKLRRVMESRLLPVQSPHPPMQRRVARANIAQVALEMLHVHSIEADDCCVQSNIGFSDVCAEIEGTLAVGVVGSQMLFRAVKGTEERGDVFFVGCGRCPLVRGLDVCAEG